MYCSLWTVVSWRGIPKGNLSCSLTFSKQVAWTQMLTNWYALLFVISACWAHFSYSPLLLFSWYHCSSLLMLNCLQVPEGMKSSSMAYASSSSSLYSGTKCPSSVGQWTMSGNLVRLSGLEFREPRKDGRSFICFWLLSRDYTLYMEWDLWSLRPEWSFLC